MFILCGHWSQSFSVRAGLAELFSVRAGLAHFVILVKQDFLLFRLTVDELLI